MTPDVDSVLSPAPPSPGPTFPGAWPPSLHRRSTTCPTPRPILDPLQLERVLDFQQRLVNQMDNPEIPSSTSFATSVSADSALAPADSLDSELTRFRTDTSTSIVTDTSVSTTCSSPERFVAAKLPQFAFKTKYSAMENDYPTRIPRPAHFSRRTSDRTRARHQGQNIFSTESPSPLRSQSSCVTVPDISPSPLVLGRASNPPPASPIIFASPTSSSFPRCMSNSQPSPRNRSSSYEYNSSPSWETSYGSEYNDRHMLNPSPSPSPSPMSGGRAHLRTLGSANRTPSIEIAAVPMLTSLSLPASPDTSMSLDMDPVAPRSPRLSPINGDTSPWSLSLSPASPVLSLVPDLSLSSPGPALDGHVLSFPSPSLSTSPFASPLSSPVLDDASVPEHVGDTSAAEYAAAIMSSAWASDGPSMAQVIPSGLLLAENDRGQIDHAAAPSSEVDAATLEEEELPEPLAYLENVDYLPIRRREVKMGGVLGKMKKLGDKVKRLLRVKSKAVGNNGGVNIDVDVRRVGGLGNSPVPDALPDVIDIQSRTSAAQVYNSLLSSQGTDSDLPLPLPPPPGLVVRKPKTRPILSSQTYRSTQARSRTNENTAERNLPTIRIRPPSSSSHAPASNNAPPKTPSPDLTVHSRPKTLAEIKSKRRLSLSALSSFARSSSPTPPVNVVTSNRHRTRPTSALAFYPRPPPLSSFRGTADTDGSATTHHPPASTFSRATSTTAVSDTIRSNYVRAHAALPDDQVSADRKKKNRRFSLSALSNFAAGHWDEGSWQRNGVVHMPLDG